ncbi:hypothetical protein LC605_27230 [Nostoc sp. CHAB 5836]|uniref:hypothetical protein n=1 Tax=Nostoc sp. CHAB 5836 TaxID=2780404 RepID=UPI001E2836A4|nr:hypothetical protein [Nostoc sp. CHAB 5836]MCC5618715.1 hypothetical protein [Nostoc sp. CHAB 5836]
MPAVFSLPSLTTATKHFFAPQFFTPRSLTPNSPFLPVARPHPLRHRCTSLTMLTFIQCLVVTTENSRILYQMLIP